MMGPTNAGPSQTPMVQKIIAATRGITSPVLMSTSGSAYNTPYRPSHMMVHTTPLHTRDSHDGLPATERARLAPQAGFLQKLGANVPEFKRRFFIVEPATHLSYFVSPHDTEPRGRLDLSGSTVEEIEQLPDGRFRFAICWGEDNNSNRKNQPRRVALEARSEEIGREWINALRRERIPALKSEIDFLQADISSRNSIIHELRREIVHFKLIERDRDDALKDARKWKRKFEELDDALRRLTQFIRQPEMKNEADENDNEEKKTDVYEIGYQDNNGVDEAEGCNPSENDASFQDGRSSSLLDITTDEDDTSPDPLHVPGTYFSALSNACHQQRELLRLASDEAATAVEDVHESSKKVEAMKKRMGNAEKHICQLWEENCELRKKLKQKKRERRVLIREVKALQQNVGVSGSAHEEPDFEDAATDQSSIASDEERLINELEEHVASSIRLHEKFLVASGKPIQSQVQTHSQPTIAIPTASNQGTMLRLESSATPTNDSPLRPKLLSLFDDEDESDDEDDCEIDHGGDERGSCASHVETGVEKKTERELDKKTESVSASASSISSIVVEPDNVPDIPESILTSTEEISCCSHSTDSFSSRKNPFDDLDKDEEVSDSLGLQKSDMESNKIVMETGRASSHLVCPLQDVTKTNGHMLVDEGVRVYHLTFNSRTIGIQFQKAPPPPQRVRGLLTAAMTSDLQYENNNVACKETSKPRGIISASHSGTSDVPNTFPMACPKDVVLVCGFEGFDDLGSNERPMLGARLVAFDGISVEVGNWTFDSIRKAIKARGRPLTLSFRNDYLTTEQRQILTRAVSEVAGSAHWAPLNRIVRPSSTTPSLTSAISHETDQFVNEGGADASSVPSELGNEELDTSATVMSSSSCWNGRRRTFSTTSSVASSNYRSFSESGSSSALSSKFAPLVANLLKGVKERKGIMPEYLSREAASVDGIPEHRVFQSNLL